MSDFNYTDAADYLVMMDEWVTLETQYREGNITQTDLVENFNKFMRVAALIGVVKMITAAMIGKDGALATALLDAEDKFDATSDKMDELLGE